MFSVVKNRLNLYTSNSFSFSPVRGMRNSHLHEAHLVANSHNVNLSLKI